MMNLPFDSLRQDQDFPLALLNNNVIETLHSIAFTGQTTATERRVLTKKNMEILNKFWKLQLST